MAPRCFPAAAAIAVLACLAVLRVANAHAGHFHGPAIPADSGAPYVVLKTCRAWNRLPAATSLVPGGSAPRLEGSALVQFYYYVNCTSKESTSVQIIVKLTNKDDGGPRRPVANYSVSGIVENRSCLELSSAGFYSLNNTADPLDPTNYLWWQSATTAENGTIRGHAANTGKAPLPNRIRSLVLYDASGSPADTVISNPAGWASRAVFCCTFPKDSAEGWRTALDGKGDNC